MRFTFIFSHFADAFIQSGKQKEEVPLTPSLRHCSNKYKLAREEEKGKEKDEDIEKDIKKIYIYFEVK